MMEKISKRNKKECRIENALMIIKRASSEFRYCIFFVVLTTDEPQF